MTQTLINTVIAAAAAIIALVVYLHQRASSKRDAALLILQEIRFAEAQIKKYNPAVGFQFYEKLLPTDSWNRNIHLFVNDFEESQIDAISNFYAKTHYLDEVIKKFSQLVLEGRVVLLSNNLNQNPPGQIGPTLPTRLPAQDLLDSVAFGLKLDLIHNSAVGQRLRELSKRKSWYSI
jgi:hypothetical protein